MFIVSVFAFDVTNYRYTKIKIKSFLRGSEKNFSSIKIKVLEIKRVFSKVLPK
ncbi:hypothetical protein GVD77_001613 [Salmonella enterica]|nr:hypothetical protein [Salmonella enterica subsp. enterica serovar Typhimurium]EDQ4236223.1 hypothetical protein [Salmonella enterica subsp. enterica serovar Typhimurium var. 5-]EDR0407075.1 hypothetical protein [Salmonella enterica subsp. enterica serovar Typhimurium var. 5-]EDR8189540.1 hypothetical protein [Salmonella enterica subsp. enterica serovar Typhimurium]EDR8913860.1 hypothetical protein [Salmonella enterica subsp. enterica serovar Typhimurium]